jgi:hypothetical protein
MSTRLIDWTESRLVAAYFAIANAGVNGDAAIYAISDLRGVTKAEDKNPFKVRTVAVYRPPHISARIPAQRNVFTVHSDTTAPFDLLPGNWSMQM